MAEEGVPGEMATAARIPAARICFTTSNAFSVVAQSVNLSVSQRSEGAHTWSARLNVERIAFSSSVGDRFDPLLCIVSGVRREMGRETNPSRVGDHHVAVHEHAGDCLVDAVEDGRAHGDVFDEMTAIGMGENYAGERGGKAARPSMISGGER